jgi:hypothetical protein
MKTLPMVSVAIGICFVVFSSGGAFAVNPPGTGQPGQTCLSGQATVEPTQNTSQAAIKSPGSVFNETLPGQGGASYSKAQANIDLTNPKAVSQYDVACFQQTQVP